MELVVEGHAPAKAIADEDLPRSDEQKTAAVHFLRFELEPGAVADLKAGKQVTFRIEHPNYRSETALTEAQRKALTADFD